MEVLRPTLAASRVCRETSDATFREGDDTGGGAGGYADATIRTVGARARGEGLLAWGVRSVSFSCLLLVVVYLSIFYI